MDRLEQFRVKYQTRRGVPWVTKAFTSRAAAEKRAKVLLSAGAKRVVIESRVVTYGDWGSE